jgi:hypothetical protein
LLARKQQQQKEHQRHFSTMLAAKSSGEGGKKKRRRRKRKKGSSDEAEETAPAPAAAVVSESLKAESLTAPAPEGPMTVTNFEGEVEEISVEDIKGVADFSFKGGDVKTDAPLPPAQVGQDVTAPITPVSAAVQGVDGSIPLPDIRDTLRRKKMEVANKGGPGGAMEDNMPKTKIDRNDRVALMKVRKEGMNKHAKNLVFYFKCL